VRILAHPNVYYELADEWEIAIRRPRGSSQRKVTEKLTINHFNRVGDGTTSDRDGRYTTFDFPSLVPAPGRPISYLETSERRRSPRPDTPARGQWNRSRDPETKPGEANRVLRPRVSPRGILVERDRKPSETGKTVNDSCTFQELRV